ncbi:MAG: NAD(P)-binding protein [Lachnospiraceae bacterium]|nr:NAD(P)-binding protein [Lachnospiraceae bacterium]
MYDYIIIGAGITGITLCKLLREKGRNVICLEKEEEPGGLCRTKRIQGHTLDIGGGHFFHTKHQEVFDLVFKHIPKEEFNYYERVSKILLGDETIDYPIESNIWQLPMNEQIEYIISVICNGEQSGRPEPGNYEEWIRWKLGDKICDEYMIPYNTKLWGVEPKEMDIDWLHKIPRVNVREVLQYCLQRKQDVTKFPAHIHFYYPKKGGFQAIINALAKDELPYIKCGEKVESIVKNDDAWVINGKYQAGKVINTTPWCDLYEALGNPVELKSDFEKIRYNRIVVSLYEKHYDINWHWRYIPDKNKPYHREFYIGNFAQDSAKNGIYLETNIINHKEGNLKIDDRPAVAEYVTDAAYPVPVIGHADAIKRILDHYGPLGLYGVGRWGQHEYQNADVSVHEAMRFVESLDREG